jgi:hypothetical protein
MAVAPRSRLQQRLGFHHRRRGLDVLVAHQRFDDQLVQRRVIEALPPRTHGRRIVRVDPVGRQANESVRIGRGSRPRVIRTHHAPARPEDQKTNN